MSTDAAGRSWRRVRATLVALGMLCAGGSYGISLAEGAPVLQLSWQPCGTRPLVSYTQVRPGEGEGCGLYLWVGNLDAVTSGYSVTLQFANADGGALADAWRYDAAGCEGTEYAGISPLGPLFPTGCSDYFPGDVAWWTWAGQFTFDPATGRELATVEVRFEPPRQAELGRGYDLALVSMYFSKATMGPSHDGLCGGLERGVCIWVSGGGYFDAEGNLIPWDTTGALVTAGIEPTPSFDCLAVPATRATWGRLKAIYRD